MQVKQLNEVTERRPTWMWPNYVPYGCLTLLDGDPGVNKSTVGYDLAARLTAAGLMPRQSSSSPSTRRPRVFRPPRRPRRVFIGSTEDDEARIRATVVSCGGDPELVTLISDLRMPSAMEGFSRLLRELSPGLVILDPLLEFLDFSIKSNEKIRQTLGPLVRLAQELDFAILGMRHLSKSSGGGNPLYRGLGSIAFMGLARSALLIEDDPHLPGQRILSHTKCNLQQKARPLVFRPVEQNGGLRPIWLGYAESSVIPPEKDSARLDEAVFVLYVTLRESGGSKWSMSAKRAAAEAGISERTLRRAYDLLGIETRKSGFASGDGWDWILPDCATVVANLRVRRRATLSQQIIQWEEQFAANAAAQTENRED
ncbi:MAG TPA: AAA family ATPase [Pirellulaceae bacterium]|nr:AAA family ATPase [Pirellulaceae bacterium]